MLKRAAQLLQLMSILNCPDHFHNFVCKEQCKAHECSYVRIFYSFIFVYFVNHAISGFILNYYAWIWWRQTRQWCLLFSCTLAWVESQQTWRDGRCSSWRHSWQCHSWTVSVGSGCCAAVEGMFLFVCLLFVKM